MIIPVLGILVAIQAATAKSSDQIEKNPDQTQRVVDLLADFQVNHDRVFSEKFAFVGKGVQVREKGSRTSVEDRWFLCVVEGPTKRLDAAGRAPGNNAGRHIESWLQHLQYDGKQLFRPSMRHEMTVDTSTPEWNDEEEKKQTRRFLAVPQPMRRLLRNSTGYDYWTSSHEACGSEYLLSDKAELLEGKYTKNGDIQATFSVESNLPSKIRITFGKKQKLLPVEVVTSVQLRGKWIAFSVTELEWEHRSKFSVPRIVRYSRFPLSKSSSTSTLEVEFEWKTGKQVVGKLDPSLKDWRTPFREMFEVGWQRSGDAVPFAK